MVTGEAECTTGRQSRHGEIINAIERLKRAKDGMQDLLSEIRLEPSLGCEDPEGKPPVPSLASFLVTTAGEIDTLTDELNNIRSSLHEALF